MSFVLIMALSNGRALEEFVYRTKGKADGKGGAAVTDVGHPLWGDYAVW